MQLERATYNALNPMSSEAPILVSLGRPIYKVAWVLSCERSMMLPSLALHCSFSPASCSVTKRRVSGHYLVMVEMKGIYENVYRQWGLHGAARTKDLYLARFQYDQLK